MFKLLTGRTAYVRAPVWASQTMQRIFPGGRRKPNEPNAGFTLFGQTASKEITYKPYAVHMNWFPTAIKYALARCICCQATLPGGVLDPPSVHRQCRLSGADASEPQWMCLAEQTRSLVAPLRSDIICDPMSGVCQLGSGDNVWLLCSSIYVHQFERKCMRCK